MKAKLVKTYRGGNVKIYELSDPIQKGKSDWRGEFSISRSLNDLYDRLFPKYKESAEKYRKSDSCYYVAISLAHTHVEKLAFPAIKINENEFTFIGDDIAGKHTFITSGGDPSTIYADEVYLRFLAGINGLHFEGIE